MLPATTLNRIRFYADGTARVYSCAPLRLVDASAIRVHTAEGTPYTAPFAVVGARSRYGTPQAASSFSLAFDTAPPAGRYTVLVDFTSSQPVELADFAPWSPKVIESALDRLTLTDIALFNRSERSLRAAPEEFHALAELPTSAARAGHVLGFDVSGQPVVYTRTGAGDIPQASTTQEGIARLATQAEGRALITSSAVLTPAALPIASTAQRGVLRLASTGSESGGTLPHVAVSPAGLISQVGAMASPAELSAGTEASVRRFTPANIKSMIDTHSGSGSQGGNAATWARQGNTDDIPDAKIRRWHGTQEEYEALSAYDDDTLYVITDSLPPAGAGTITAVVAGTGVAGGATAGSATVALAPGYSELYPHEFTAASTNLNTLALDGWWSSAGYSYINGPEQEAADSDDLLLFQDHEGSVWNHRARVTRQVNSVYYVETYHRQSRDNRTTWSAWVKETTNFSELSGTLALAQIPNSLITSAKLHSTITSRLPTAGPGNSKLWGTNATGTLGWYDIPAGGGGGTGTLTGITAGEGLTGGGTSGAVTLAIADSGIDPDKLNADTETEKRAMVERIDARGYRGAWDSLAGASIKAGEVVIHESVAYICLVAHTRQAATPAADPVHWSMLTTFQGAWSDKAYITGSIVSHQSKFYLATRGRSAGSLAPGSASDTAWHQLDSTGSTAAPASISIRGALLAVTTTLPTTATNETIAAVWDRKAGVFETAPSVEERSDGWRERMLWFSFEDTPVSTELLGFIFVARVGDDAVWQINVPLGGTGSAQDQTRDQHTYGPLKFSDSALIDVVFHTGQGDDNYHGSGYVLRGDNSVLPTGSSVAVYEWRLVASEGPLTAAQIDQQIDERVPLARIPTASPGNNKVWGTDSSGNTAWRDIEADATEVQSVEYDDLASVDQTAWTNLLPSSGETASGFITEIPSAGQHIKLEGGAYLIDVQADVLSTEERASPQLRLTWGTTTSGTFTGAGIAYSNTHYMRYSNRAEKVSLQALVHISSSEAVELYLAVRCAAAAPSGDGQGQFSMTNAEASFYRWGGAANAGDANVQADWNETDATHHGYIKNKPDTFPGYGENVSWAAINTDVTYDADASRALHGRILTAQHFGSSERLIIDQPASPEQSMSCVLFNHVARTLRLRLIARQANLAVRRNYDFTVAASAIVQISWLPDDSAWHYWQHKPGGLLPGEIQALIDAKHNTLASWIRANTALPANLLPSRTAPVVARFHMRVTGANLATNLTGTFAGWNRWEKVTTSGAYAVTGSVVNGRGLLLHVPALGDNPSNGAEHIGYVARVWNDSNNAQGHRPVCKQVFSLHPMTDNGAETSAEEWVFKTKRADDAYGSSGGTSEENQGHLGVLQFLPLIQRAYRNPAFQVRPSMYSYNSTTGAQSIHIELSELWN